MAIDSLGNLYVTSTSTSNNTQYLSKLDGLTGAHILDTPITHAAALSLEILGDRLLMSTTSGVDLLNTATLSLVKANFIPEGQAWDLAYNGADKLYVINIGVDNLEIWDPFTGALISTNFQPHLRDFPMQIALDLKGHMFIAVTGESSDVTPAVQLYDEATGELLDKTFIVRTNSSRTDSKPIAIVYSPLSIGTQAVPEPSTYGLFCMLGLGLLSFRRRIMAKARKTRRSRN